jgi:hypothetical protein
VVQAKVERGSRSQVFECGGELVMLDLAMLLSDVVRFNPLLSVPASPFIVQGEGW